MSKEFTYDDKYKFNEKWFDGMIPGWYQIFDHVKQEKEIKDVLEVGCYEGRASVFVLENYLGKGDTYTVVDTFGGTLEEHGMKGTAERLKESDFIYDNFSHNISFFPDIDFTTYRDRSEYRLPKLVEEGKTYDFIYIDASHRADDTLVDAYYAHKMLRPGGLLIFDDFGWKSKSDDRLVASPEFGIRAFVSMYEEDYTVIGHGYQLALVKKSKWESSTNIKTE